MNSPAANPFIQRAWKATLYRFLQKKPGHVGPIRRLIVAYGRALFLNSSASLRALNAKAPTIHQFRKSDSRGRNTALPWIPRYCSAIPLEEGLRQPKESSVLDSRPPPRARTDLRQRSPSVLVLIWPCLWKDHCWASISIIAKGCEIDVTLL